MRVNGRNLRLTTLRLVVDFDGVGIQNSRPDRIGKIQNTVM